MKLIDLDAEQDYILDGKYAVKAGTDYMPVCREIKRALAQLAQKQREIGQPCYKIYAKYKQQGRQGMRQYDFFVDTAGLLNHWMIFDPSVLYIRERPFTKSDRAHLGKTVFWTREEAEQAIKRKEQEHE